MNNRLALISLYNTNNLGVRYLISYLKNKGFEVSGIFFKEMFTNDAQKATKKEKSILIDILKKIDPGIVGISVSCSALLKTATAITHEVHDVLDIPVIWGGAHSIIMPEESIQIADFVCAGEGEIALSRLLSSINHSSNNISSIPNLWFKQNGKVISNKIEPVDKTFCTLPFPDYSNENKFFINQNFIKHRDPFRDEPWVYSMMTSKGCKYLCTYCSNNIFMKVSGGKKVYIRRRSVDNVIDELVSIRKKFPSIRMIQFLDDEFAGDANWIIDFCHLYKKEINLPFWCCYHPLGITDESIKQLKEAGLQHVQMGVQSASAYIRKKIFHRPESNKVISSTIKLMNKNRVTPKIDLIFDNPFENEKDKKEAIDFLLELKRPFDFHLLSLLFFPKTRLTERALKEKIISEKDIEGQSEKALSQLVITRDYARLKSELFWISITSLTGKSFIPKFLIHQLSKSKKLKNNPIPLWYFANIANLIRLGQNGFAAALRGQLTYSFVKKYIGHFIKVGS